MRQYAWYCVEQDCIVLQSIIEDCFIAFEWPHENVIKIINEYGTDIDPMFLFTFMPLGEL